MHALSSQTSGSLPSATPRCFAPHAVSCANLAGPSSCQLCEMKESTAPSAAPTVRPYIDVSWFEFMSSSRSALSGSARKRRAPSPRTSFADEPETRAAIAAASCW